MLCAVHACVSVYACMCMHACGQGQRNLHAATYLTWFLFSILPHLYNPDPLLDSHDCVHFKEKLNPAPQIGLSAWMLLPIIAHGQRRDKWCFEHQQAEGLGGRCSWVQILICSWLHLLIQEAAWPPVSLLLQHKESHSSPPQKEETPRRIPHMPCRPFIYSPMEWSLWFPSSQKSVQGCWPWIPYGDQEHGAHISLATSMVPTDCTSSCRAPGWLSHPVGGRRCWESGRCSG